MRRSVEAPNAVLVLDGPRRLRLDDDDALARHRDDEVGLAHQLVQMLPDDERMEHGPVLPPDDPLEGVEQSPFRGVRSEASDLGDHAHHGVEVKGRKDTE